MAAVIPPYLPKADLLRDKIVLITGAGDGIGAALAKGCARHGATVVLLGKTVAKLETVYDQIEQSGAPQPAIYPLNLEGATPKDYADLAATMQQEFGRVDGLVHNAAILGSLTPLHQYDIELWYKVMQINLHAPFMLTGALLDLLKQSESGSVIFTSSAVGRTGQAYWGGYAVSKAGNESMMQILAAELRQNTAIRVNSLNPGAVRTAMRARAFPGEDRNSITPAEDVVPAYLYLLGDDSREISGQQFDAQ